MIAQSTQLLYSRGSCTCTSDLVGSLPAKSEVQVQDPRAQAKCAVAPLISQSTQGPAGTAEIREVQDPFACGVWPSVHHTPVGFRWDGDWETPTHFASSSVLAVIEESPDQMKRRVVSERNSERSAHHSSAGQALRQYVLASTAYSSWYTYSVQPDGVDWAVRAAHIMQVPDNCMGARREIQEIPHYVCGPQSQNILGIVLSTCQNPDISGGAHL
eukprot:COSAG02_NODE_10049_length_2038_cov_2.604951_1_plen_215_part_00